MQEIIPKKSRTDKYTTNEEAINKNIITTDQTSQKQDTDYAPVENNQTSNTTITPIKEFNKDIILGNLMKHIRQTKDSLLFAVFTSIKDYFVDGNCFVIECDSAVNYQDINNQNTLETVNNILQKIDSSLCFRVQLNEDRTSQIIAENIKVLKETFGKLIIFKEKKNKY